MTNQDPGLRGEEIVGLLLDNCRKDDFGGYDPFDFLNSVVFRALGLDHFELSRLAWLQLGKRLPINIRPLVGVPRKRNPKGVALFMLGMHENFLRTGDPRVLVEAASLGDWLLGQACDRSRWGHYCWGYHFDWQARAFFVPQGTPNIITSCYVARAMFDVGNATNRQDMIDAACDTAQFIARSLLTEEGGRRYFAYIPGEVAFVHNASLWGAAWCVHVGKITGDSGLCRLGLAVAHESVSMQARDGSWRYGTLPHHGFVDGFHTGYNLEALQIIQDHAGDETLRSALHCGSVYYLEQLFDRRCTPKYYKGSLYPLDTHNFAQAIITLLRVVGGSRGGELANRVMQRVIEELYLPDRGRFAYQKHKYFTNKVNYSRWTQAWIFYALSALVRHNAEDKNASG